MVCAIMQDSFDTLVIVFPKAKIKIFLTLFATFDKELQRQANGDNGSVTVNANDDASDDDSVASNAYEPVNKKKAKSKYKWIDSYIFMCLLSLPSIVEEYGPPRLYLEGYDMGENILQFLNQLWSGFRTGWQQHALTRVFRQMTLKRLGANKLP
jgi:hypothetical protein